MKDVTLDAMETHAATSVARQVRYNIMTWAAAKPTYNEFVQTVQMAVTYSCNEMSLNPQLVQGHKEDQLTNMIVSGLKHMGFDARFDTTIGGHCDVTVEQSDYSWLAEAKIHKGNKWLWQGYKQLTTRYSPGTPGSRYGGMLIYCFKPRTDLLMQKWQERLVAEDSSIQISLDSSYVAAAFRSDAVSRRTGEVLSVLHVPVSLLFEPQDHKGTSKASATRSGRQAPDRSEVAVKRRA